RRSRAQIPDIARGGDPSDRDRDSRGSYVRRGREKRAQGVAARGGSVRDDEKREGRPRRNGPRGELERDPLGHGDPLVEHAPVSIDQSEVARRAEQGGSRESDREGIESDSPSERGEIEPEELNVRAGDRL